MKNIDIVFFDAASGHRSAAVAVQKALQAIHPDWDIQTINIVNIFDHHKTFGKIVRKGIARFNQQLVRDKVFDLGGQINLSLLFHDTVYSRGIRRIATYWNQRVPDVVISVTPMYNPVLYKAARLVNAQVQCITIPVDFEEVKPRYWFTPKVPQYYILSTERLAVQARRAKIEERFISQIPGMIVDPSSYQKISIDKKKVLQDLQLRPDYPTVFLSFGGQGSLRSMEIAVEIEKEKLPVNLICMCGKNEKLFQELTNFKTSYPKAVFSYTKETPLYYLHLSDFAIGKPGAMTITEALITETPQIALQSTGMRPVQKGNESWIHQSGVGLVAPKVTDIVFCLKKMMKEEGTFKQKIKENVHQGIFKCADVISKIVDQP